MAKSPTIFIRRVAGWRCEIGTDKSVLLRVLLYAAYNNTRKSTDSSVPISHRHPAGRTSLLQEVKAPPVNIMTTKAFEFGLSTVDRVIAPDIITYGRPGRLPHKISRTDRSRHRHLCRVFSPSGTLNAPQCGTALHSSTSVHMHISAQTERD